MSGPGKKLVGNNRCPHGVLPGSNRHVGETIVANFNQHKGEWQIPFLGGEERAPTAAFVMSPVENVMRAQSRVQVNEPPTIPNMRVQKYYAVAIGRRPCIYVQEGGDRSSGRVWWQRA